MTFNCELCQSEFSVLSGRMILKIYELPKINNTIPKYCQTHVLTIIIYQANSMSQLQLVSSELYPINFTENVALGEKDSFGPKLKKVLGRIFF